MVDTLIGLSLFAWAPFLSVIVGVLYFACSSPTAPLLRRVVSSAYAPSAAVIYLAIPFLPSALSNPQIARLYPALVAVPLLLLLVSLFRFPGPRWAHVVLMPIAVVSVLWQGAWSYWGVYGK